MLKQKKFRFGAQMSMFSTRVIHEAECPEIAPPQCEEYEIKPHIHDQGISFFQLNLNANMSLPKGIQISVSAPLDVKHLTIDYRLLQDDSSYDPPYAGIHHRNETLVGFGDGSLMIQTFRQFGSFTAGFGLGSSLPLGRTEENPYNLSSAGKEHQHLQMGSGVFSPSFSFVGIWNRMRWGVLSNINGQWSAYENDKSYKPPSRLNMGLGPWWTSSPRLRFLGQVRGQFHTSEEWSGSPAPNSGKIALGLAGAVMWRFKPDLEFLFRAERNIFQTVLIKANEYQNDSIPPALIFSLGVNWWR